MTLPKALSDLIGGRDDADLLVRLRRRDPESVGLLYDRYGKAAYDLAFRILRDADAAESAVAEAVLKCWNKVSGFRETRGGALGVWLLATTYTSALENRNGLSLRVMDRGALLQDWSKAIDADRLQEAHYGLRKLDAEEKRILELTFFEGLTLTQLTTGLGLTRAEVDKLIQSAMAKLVFVEQE